MTEVGGSSRVMGMGGGILCWGGFAFHWFICLIRGSVLGMNIGTSQGAREMDFDDFLESLNELIGHGFRLKEEVYVEVVRKAREF